MYATRQVRGVDPRVVCALYSSLLLDHDAHVESIALQYCTMVQLLRVASMTTPHLQAPS